VVTVCNDLVAYRCYYAQDPLPLPYLQDPNLTAYDIKLEVALQSAKMEQPFTIVRSNAKVMSMRLHLV